MLAYRDKCGTNGLHKRSRQNDRQTADKEQQSAFGAWD